MMHHVLGLMAYLPSQLSPVSPQAPAGVESTITPLMGWGMWIALLAGFGGLVVSGIMMAVGRRNRSQMAADGAIGLPWVIGGLSVCAIAVPLVNALL